MKPNILVVLLCLHYCIAIGEGAAAAINDQNDAMSQVIVTKESSTSASALASASAETTQRLFDDNDNDDDIADKCSESTNYYSSSFNEKLILALLKSKFQKENKKDDVTKVDLDDTGGTSSSMDDSDNGGKYDSLFCWLFNLKFNIPDEHFRSGIFSVSIKDMVCSKIEIQTISTSYHPSDNTKKKTIDPSLSFSIDGVSATCSGRYKSGLTGGTVTVTVQTIENTSSVETETTFEPYFIHPNPKQTSTTDNNHLSSSSSSSTLTAAIRTKNITAPHSGKIATCQTNLEVPKSGGIKFSGSVSAKLIGLFSGSIAKHVTSVLENEICPTIQTEVDDGWDKMLKKLDTHLEALLDSSNDNTLFLPTSSSSDSDSDSTPGDIYNSGNNGDKNGNSDNSSSGIISWESDMSILKQTLMTFNQFLSSHMDRGIILSLLDRIGLKSYSDNENNDNENYLECNSSTDCGLFFRGVNGMIRYVTDDMGAINITTNSHEFMFTLKEIGDVKLTLYNVQIAGLDTFTKMEMLPKNDHMLSFDVQSQKGFEVQGRVELNIDPIENGIIQGGSLHESFDMIFNISSISMEAEIDVAVLREKLEVISIGDIIHRSDNDTMSTLLSSLAYANFTQLQPRLHIDSLKFIPLFQDGSKDDTSLEASIDQMINNLIKLFLNEYDLLWTESLVAFAQGPLRSKLNEALERMISEVLFNHDDKSLDNNVEQYSDGDSHYFHFDNSSFVKEIHDFFASENWIMRWNSFASCVATYLRSTTCRSNTLQSGNESSSFNIAIKNLTVENVDRVDSIDIIKAMDEFHIKSGISSNWDTPDSDFVSNSTKNNANLLVGLLAGLEWPLLDLNAALSTSASFGGLLSQMGAKLVYDLEALNQISLYETLKDPIVLSKPVSRESGFYDFLSSIDTIDFGFNITGTIGKESRFFSYMSQDGATLGSSVTSILSTFNIILQDSVNSVTQMGLSLTNASTYEKAMKDTETQKGHFSIFWYITIGVVFTFMNITYFYFYNGTKQRRLVITRKEQSPQTCTVPLSLAFHQKISYTMRILVPLIIAGTILIFIVSNLSTGAAVDVEVKGTNNITEGTISIPSVFTFSLGKTVGEMYQAKVYTLMTLVLVFSGIWPYVKLLVMLVAWVTNERWMTLERKERLLIFLDAFGKYSLVDSFVLVLMLVSFRFHFDIAEIGVIDSFVIPKDGFYTFLCATILSLVIGHTVTFLHRYSMMPKISSNANSEKESLGSHIFEMKNPSQRLIQLSQTGKKVWLSVNLLSVILLVVGAAEKCFIFEFKGLAGLVLGDKREARYSLISLGTSLPLSVKDPSNIGIISIQWTYFFFALVMPFACIIIANILFYCPMSLKNQNRLFVLAEICNAWSAIEVFLLSVLASMLELSQFAAFMVGDHCNFLKGDLMKDLFHEEDTCFSVQSGLGLGAIYLCCGVFMQCSIMYISLRLCHQAVEERMEREGMMKSHTKNREIDSLLFKFISVILFQSTISD